MYRIYIVEDDPAISRLMSESLSRWGFECRRAADFLKISDEAHDFSPHLVILDISLPYFDGFYWCERLRRESNVPVMFVSSHTDNIDIVMAVNMGADDYITKPFSTDVLVAKINALLRREYSYIKSKPVLEAGGARLGADGTLCFGDQKIDLTKNERRILELLFERKGAIVSRSDIMTALWEDESYIDDNTLTVNINRLRKKLSDAGLDGLIVTKKGEGYMVND